jgi:hypothetical protein
VFAIEAKRSKNRLFRLRVNCSDQLSYRGNPCSNLYVARAGDNGKTIHSPVANDWPEQRNFRLAFQ